MQNVELIKEVEQRIVDSYGKGVDIDFQDERGDGKHFYISIVSDKFEGLSRIERSQQIYKILDDLLKKDYIHALRMKLKTSNEL
ncbi:BolA family transcriptional regulator [Candidatus Gracilibacteria bacterium 28_42_T64]|nr:BolA family transcriptional regulator [Candidatus Gracilibacteria bacterium 28_42_T64]